MAWRIEESVIRGEIDNRRKGVVCGKLWLEGYPGPVVLELSGNACSDLAGCLLRFRNTRPPVPMRNDATFLALQRGKIGDLTASRKVRVYDVPVEEAYWMSKRGEKPPEHLANSLYLEWFSEANGRVVVESADYALEISEPAWHYTAEDEDQRRRDAASGWGEFLGRLDAAIAQRQRGAKDPEEEWDEHDYERFLKECDARGEKYRELLEKYGDSEEAQERIAEEMGWTRDLAEEEEAAEEEEEGRERIEEMNRALEEAVEDPDPEPDPAREGIDWIRAPGGEIRHPLQHRCFEAAIQLWQECERLGLGGAGDDDLAQFTEEFQITGAKLAGALQGIAQGRQQPEPAFTVACLKRALDHLHHAQAGCEAVARKQLLPEALLAMGRRDLFEIREGILALMQELRGHH